MESIWMRDIEESHFPELIGDISTDTLVIGGGMAGVLTAFKLRNAGVECVLLEAGRIGMSVTARTTAVISAQHGVLYQDLVEKFGKETAKGYLDANLRAVSEFRELAEGIDCDFEPRPSLLYSRTGSSKLVREAGVVNALGFPAYFTKEVPPGIDGAGGEVFPDMAQFHPIKFLRGIAGDLHIYERSVVRRVANMTAYTDAGSVKARKIVISSHFPFIDRHGMYFVKMHQKRESVVTVEGGPELGCTMVENTEAGFFLRNYKNYLIVGCGNHIPGKESEDFSRISLFLKRYVPKAREVCRWVNQDCFTLDGVPYIGRYSPAEPDIYVATGFNAWGMTSSMISSEIIKDAILGQENAFTSVFSPARPMPALPVLENAGRSAVNLLTPTLPRCTHLGCALKHNGQEHTWDCPCHGSRFAEDGTVVSGPAVKRARIKEQAR